MPCWQESYWRRACWCFIGRRAYASNPGGYQRASSRPHVSRISYYHKPAAKLFRHHHHASRALARGRMPRNRISSASSSLGINNQGHKKSRIESRQAPLAVTEMSVFSASRQVAAARNSGSERNSAHVARHKRLSRGCARNHQSKCSRPILLFASAMARACPSRRAAGGRRRRASSIL